MIIDDKFNFSKHLKKIIMKAWRATEKPEKCVLNAGGQLKREKIVYGLRLESRNYN